MTAMKFLTHGTKVPRQLRFRAFLGCLEIMLVAQPGMRMLDIGGGDGLHARFFRNRGLHVDVLDIQEGMEDLIFEGEYESFTPSKKYDIIWCSHVYEHIINPGIFLEKIHRDLRPGGYVAITVPPMKSDMLFEHVTLWNGGLLLIHLIKCGFDCRAARVGAYNYNITIIAKKSTEPLHLQHYQLLPSVNKSGGYFNGDIAFLNWENKKLPLPDGFDDFKISIPEILDRYSNAPLKPEFAAGETSEGRRTYIYFDKQEELAVLVA
ncbi:MAG: class I SAM-dependent methyltransferase [Alphaproteobacteria bacterium]|nr:class I SAM-dependent methyltransferase [Alphaproteobacteria bacterium]